MSKIKEGDLTEVGEAPPESNELLQQGVFSYRQNRESADARLPGFDSSTVATYQIRFDDALAIAGAGLVAVADVAWAGAR